MFTFRKGNILLDPADALVNPVNCVGVMGAGLAKQFKEHYPENFNAYQAACKARQINVGTIFVYERPIGYVVRYIFNFPTKVHWKDPSRLEYISSALKDLRAKIIQHEVRSIAIPRIGCGLGGLPWVQVQNMILHTLDGLDDTDVRIYAYD